MEREQTSNGTNQSKHFHKVLLAINSQDGERSYFKIPCDKKLQNLFSNYCKQKHLNYNDVRFVYDGRRVNATKTPTELGLEDGDEIDAMMHQDGGGSTLPTFSTLIEN